MALLLRGRPGRVVWGLGLLPLRLRCLAQIIAAGRPGSARGQALTLARRLPPAPAVAPAVAVATVRGQSETGRLEHRRCYPLGWPIERRRPVFGTGSFP